ncbi:Transcriptional activator spt7 [Coemansia interrupta]|uniref:Transcriptional activator spt7 n=1 Tax=Coemansia interrupta TaxID=1126814 RepID=A0A9W8HRG2_9FUNG|nr:Transcriptional activator spt7 [Coemansia interrupta]
MADQQRQQHQHKDRHLRLKLRMGAIDLTSNWAERSYHVAQKLEERGEWPAFLTSDELPWLRRALETPDLWSRFITPRAEQWRLQAPPPPIFDLAAPAQVKNGSAATSNGTGKRNAPTDDDGDSEMADSTGGRSSSRQHASKRARAASTGMFNGDDDDDDMLSAISESDIDMAMWTGDGSVASNAVTPGSLAETPRAAAVGRGGSARETLAAAECSVVCAMAAFHARSAIFEQYAAVLCGTGECRACTSTAAAYDAIAYVEGQLAGGTNGIWSGDDSDAATVGVPSVDEGRPPAPLVSRSLDEDDNYDDDGDDDGKDDGGVEKQAEGKNEGLKAEKSSSSVSAETAVASAGAVSSAKTGGEPGAATGGEPGAAATQADGGTGHRFALRAVFHTLDEVAEAVHAQEVHEIHVQQIKDVASQRAAEPKDMLVHKLGTLQNMKNLAQFIDSNRDSVRLSTRELSHLLSEVRPKRTKWANERRVGQAELYDALEHTLNELKAMGEASAPFLAQVKRKDAPDYYKVIKHPMDLGAMTKNLRSEAYDNKRQFADHLQLIRDNCYTYNTEPGNYYRRSVDQLMAKAKVLLEHVPDITVREKGAGAPAVARAASVMGTEDAHTEFGDESGNESPAPSSMLDAGHAPGTGLQSAPPPDLLVAADGANGAGSSDAQQQQQQQQDAGHDAPPLSTLAHNIQRATSAAIADIAEGYERPLCDALWSTKARRQLAEYSRRLEHDAASDLCERHVPLRTSANMHAFVDATHDAYEPVSARDLAAVSRQCVDIARLRTVYPQAAGGGNAESRRRNEALDAERAAWLQDAEEIEQGVWAFAEECEPAAGLPLPESLAQQAAKPGVLRWLNDDCEATVDGSPDVEPLARPPLDAYAAARFPDNAMWRAMADNVDRLRSIREIDGKIWAAKLNLPLGHTNPLGGVPETRLSRATDDASHASTRDLVSEHAGRPDPPQPLVLDAASARSLLQRTGALLLAHAGFDSVTATAMSTATDFFIDYMANLGRTLRTYMDKHARTMSTEAILAHALYDNGTEDLVELEYYARAEIAKQGVKLADLQKRLARAHQELMSEGRPDAAAAADASVFDTGDAYMTGMVGGLGDLGDDFLGFKELGLDKEFGVEVLSVPQRLWYGRGNVPGDGALQPTMQEELPHRPPAPWPPVVSPAGHIGLMRQFLCRKLKETNGADPPGYEGIADADQDAAEDGGSSEPPKVFTEPAAQPLPETWLPIPEEESLPQRMRYGAARPKVPPPNYLTHPKTHMHVGSGQVATPARGARKKPAKTTGLGAKKKSAGGAAAAAAASTPAPAADAADVASST